MPCFEQTGTKPFHVYDEEQQDEGLGIRLRERECRARHTTRNELLQAPSISLAKLVGKLLEERSRSDILLETRKLEPSLLLQILHDPLRQRLGGSRVLPRIQLPINHNMGLQKPIRTLKLSSELPNLVLREEPDILKGGGRAGLVNTSSRQNRVVGNHPPQPEAHKFSLPHW